MAKYKVLEASYIGDRFISEDEIKAAGAAGVIVDSSEISGLVRPGIDNHLELVEGNAEAIAKENHAKILAEAHQAGVDWVSEATPHDEIQGHLIHRKISDMSDVFKAPSPFNMPDIELQRAAKAEAERKEALARHDQAAA